MLEVCCGSFASTQNAVAGGARRIELCQALSLDGLTPSIGLLRELRERFPELLIHVLIRPREGDFVYTQAEVDVMLRDIEQAVAAGATAIVGGALTAENTIDLAATRSLIAASAGLPFTFHRAFDRVADQERALEQLIDLGVSRVLTSGGAASAEAGIPQLRKLVEQARGRIGILPGGGVTKQNVLRILRETGAQEIHGSLSVKDAHGFAVTSADDVRAVLGMI